jgi:ubiquitin carboxyl-terminal hydrolase 22/27/51
MQFILNSLHSSSSPTVSSSSPLPTSSSQKNGIAHDKSCTCVIHKTFYGKLQSTVTCGECKNITTAVDPFMDLSLDLRLVAAGGKKRKLNGNGSSNKNGKENGANGKNGKDGDGGKDGEEGMKLEECLRRFTHEEKLEKDEYTCQKCRKGAYATKQLSVRRLPPVLSVHLKVGFFSSSLLLLSGSPRRHFAL